MLVLWLKLLKFFKLYFSVTFLESVVPDTMVDACTVEVVTVMNTKEVNMFLRVRTVITKIKHYDNPT